MGAQNSREKITSSPWRVLLGTVDLLHAVAVKLGSGLGDRGVGLGVGVSASARIDVLLRRLFDLCSKVYLL
jgi:hypothetical protein